MTHQTAVQDDAITSTLADVCSWRWVNTYQTDKPIPAQLWDDLNKSSIHAIDFLESVGCPDIDKTNWQEDGVTINILRIPCTDDDTYQVTVEYYK